jgi:transposase-like protein
MPTRRNSSIPIEWEHMFVSSGPRYSEDEARFAIAASRSWSEALRRPDARKSIDPPYPQLVREVRALGFSATARRYGASDNAIRKWIRAYESEMERAQRAA